MTLYEIDQRLFELLEQVDPETGELLASPEDFAQLQMTRKEKLENTALYIKNLRSEAVAIKGEEDILAKRRKRIESKISWLESNLKASLGGNSFETSRCSVKFKQNPESVKYTDEKAAMAWAVEYSQDCIKFAPPTLSKADIKKKLKSGEQIPGVELVREIRMEVL